MELEAMNLTEIRQRGESEACSVRASRGEKKPSVESIERFRKAKQREMAIKSILNKASALDW